MTLPTSTRSAEAPTVAEAGSAIESESAKRLPVLRVRWQLQFTKCSLKCPYCIAEWTKRPVDFNAERFFAVVDRLLALPYRLVIRLGVEGEIFLSPEIQEGVIRMSHHPKVEGISFSSNFMASDEKISSFLDRANIAKIGIGATLHDTQIDEKAKEGFFRRIEMTQKRGVLIFVGYVAKPDRFEYMKEYKARLDAMGVPFIPNEYNGALEHVPYPEGYTAAEREFMKGYFFADHYYRMLVEHENPKGKPCLAGHRYIYLGSDGKILSCGNDRNMPWNLWQKLAGRLNKKWPQRIQKWRIKRHQLGNILTDDLKLSDKPRICPHISCTCGNEAQAFYSVGRDYHRTRTLRVIYPKARAAEYEARYPNLKPVENDSCSLV